MGAFVTVNLVLASIMNQFLELEKSMPLPGSSSLYASAFVEGNGKNKYIVLFLRQYRGKVQSLQFIITDNLADALSSVKKSNYSIKKKITLIIDVKYSHEFKQDGAQTKLVNKLLDW